MRQHWHDLRRASCQSEGGSRGGTPAVRVLLPEFVAFDRLSIVFGKGYCSDDRGLHGGLRVAGSPQGFPSWVVREKVLVPLQALKQALCILGSYQQYGPTGVATDCYES
eukprot:5377113-Amphidinium_carterae.1